jgi:hypothetical protein
MSTGPSTSASPASSPTWARASTRSSRPPRADRRRQGPDHPARRLPEGPRHRRRPPDRLEEKFDTFDFRTRPYWRRNAVAGEEVAAAEVGHRPLEGAEGRAEAVVDDDMREEMVDALSTSRSSDTHYDEDEGIGRGSPTPRPPPPSEQLADGQPQPRPVRHHRGQPLGRQLRHLDRQRRHHQRHLVGDHHRRAKGMARRATAPPASAPSARTATAPTARSTSCCSCGPARSTSCAPTRTSRRSTRTPAA